MDPVLPMMIHLGVEVIDGSECEHFVRDEGLERVHMYFKTSKDCLSGTEKEWSPRRLVHEDVTEGKVTTTMTYDITDFTAVQDFPAAEFTLDSISQGLVHEECERFVGGFPYVHLFHYYVRV